MRLSTFIVALPILLVSSAVPLDSSRADAELSAQLPKIKVFTTGGTIQSKGSHRLKLSDYSDGKVTPEELLADVPELQRIAQIEVVEISNKGSGSIGTAEHLAL